MSIRTREPLNAELEALLKVERRPLAQSEAVRARAFARMRTALAAPSLVLKRPRFEVSSVVWPAAAVLGFGAAAAAAAARIDRYFSTPLPVSSATAISAPARDAQSMPSAQTPPLPVSGASELVGRAAPPGGSAIQPRRQATAPSDAKAAPSAQSPTKALASESYPQELALLQPARAAIARGDFAVALSAISEHSRRFPSGLLGEERDALRVRALFGSHRDEEARRAATAFRSRYPRSGLLSSITRKVENNP